MSISQPSISDLDSQMLLLPHSQARKNNQTNRGRVLVKGLFLGHVGRPVDIVFEKKDRRDVGVDEDWQLEPAAQTQDLYPKS